MSSSVIFQIQSFLIVATLLFGVYHRRFKSKHMKIMKFAMAWDLLLVLQIELNRGAINKAAQALTNPLLLNIHVGLAVSTVLLYIPVFILGMKLSNGQESVRKPHKFLALTALTLRILTLITSNLIK